MCNKVDVETAFPGIHERTAERAMFLDAVRGKLLALAESGQPLNPRTTKHLEESNPPISRSTTEYEICRMSEMGLLAFNGTGYILNTGRE